ncbi:MAG: ABC transporter substrate-binding protein, partial [Solirubrobacteraceae bacterium]
MSHPRMRWLGALGITIALGAGVVGCGSSGTNSSGGAPGVTKTSITFGTHQPLTGPAAPGYSEIAPASQAYFDYVNAHGGVFGRKIHLIIKDDAYNPTNTVNVVHQLVLQDKVFGIVEGLGTPTHTKVVGYLNASKVPDLFVASGCPCWDNGSSQPETFGWQPNYTIEGKILGQYIKQHFPGQKVGVLYQDDDFGQGGLAGISAEVPAADIVAKQPYQSGTTTLAAQVTAIKASGAKVLVDFTVPIYTAIAQLTSFTLGYKPQLVVSNVGIDPITVGALLKAVSKGKASGTGLIEGAITDAY